MASAPELVSQSELPHINVSADTVRDVAQRVKTAGRDLLEQAANLDSAWEPLPAVLTMGSGIEALFDQMPPVVKAAAEAANSMVAAGVVYEQFADDIQNAQRRASSLGSDIDWFLLKVGENAAENEILGPIEQLITGHAPKTWQQQPALVRENDEYRAQARTLRSTWLHAQEDAAAGLKSAKADLSHLDYTTLGVELGIVLGTISPVVALNADGLPSGSQSALTQDQMDDYAARLIAKYGQGGMTKEVSNFYRSMPGPNDIGPADPNVETPGLSEAFGKSFEDGEFELVTVKAGTIVYRAISEDGRPSGSFVTFTKPNSSADAEELSYLQQYGNNAEKVQTLRIDSDTQMYIGKTADGDGIQGVLPTGTRTGDISTEINVEPLPPVDFDSAPVIETPVEPEIPEIPFDPEDLAAMNEFAIAAALTKIVDLLDQCENDEGLKRRLRELAAILGNPAATPAAIHEASWAAGRSISGMGSILDGDWTPRVGSGFTKSEVNARIGELTDELFELTKNITKPKP